MRRSPRGPPAVPTPSRGQFEAVGALYRRTLVAIVAVAAPAPRNRPRNGGRSNQQSRSPRRSRSSSPTVRTISNSVSGRVAGPATAVTRWRRVTARRPSRSRTRMRLGPDRELARPASRRAAAARVVRTSPDRAILRPSVGSGVAGGRRPTAAVDGGDHGRLGRPADDRGHEGRTTPTRGPRFHRGPIRLGCRAGRSRDGDRSTSANCAAGHPADSHELSHGHPRVGSLLACPRAMDRVLTRN